MRKLQPWLMIVKNLFGSAANRPLATTLFVAASLLGVMLLANYQAATDFLRVSAAPTATPAPKQQGCCANQPAVLRRMIGTYYTTEDGFKSILVLNNKGPHQIMVNPILHSQNGHTFNAPAVAVDGQSSSEVDLNALALSAGSQFRSGSFEFTYNGRLMEMGGGLRIVDAEKSLIFDEQMLEPGMKFSSPRLEAVYALPFESARVSIILTNTTAQPLALSGSATFNIGNGHPPLHGQLRPYQTLVIDLPHGLTKKAAAGAVSLNHNGSTGALLAMIHVQESDKGYSEAVNFADPAQGKTTQLHGAGLQLGSVNGSVLRQIIVVRNIGSNATTVSASVPFAKQNGETGKIALPQLALAPNEIKLLNTSNTQLRRNDFVTAGLEIEYQGAPGSVIAATTSVSQSGDQVFVLPLKDPQGGMSSTGGYPWFIKESSTTVVFIKNVTNEEQEFMLDIAFTGGNWKSNLRTLAAGQTFALDLRKVRNSQEKDTEGNVIPRGAASGHISWSYRGRHNKVLIGRAQTVDFNNGIASTYECQCFCGWSWGDEARILPGAVTGFPGDVQTFQIQSRYRNCFGWDMGWVTLSNYFLNNYVSYFSDDPNVASLAAPAIGSANAPGSTNLRATWTEYYYNFDENYGYCPAIAAAAACAVFCQVNDFQITTSNATIWPSETGAAGAVTSTTITVQTTPATPMRSVEVFFGEIAGSGGHVNHAGMRPLGTLAATSGTTDANGRFQTTYTSSVFAGALTIQARMASTSFIRALIQEVTVPGLAALGADNAYILHHHDDYHPPYHFGAASARANLPLIANAYNNQFYPSGIVPHAEKLNFNDMSLINGGKFEIAGNWHLANEAHGEHRLGLNCDLRSRNVPEERWATLRDIFRARGSENFLDETNTPSPHWHLRFE